jgi:hypothetical protein
VDPPTNNSILKWYNNFIEKECICDQRKGHSGRPSVSEQVVDQVREAFLSSPKKSTHRASRELHVPQSTVSKILRKRLRFHPFTRCNWSKSYTHKTIKRDLNVAGISRC